MSVPVPAVAQKVITPSLAIEWLFRVGVAMCFIGHGAFGIITKEAWLPYFGLVGIGSETAYALMPLIGLMDIAIGVAGLLSPRRFLLFYMIVWTTWTAALRPLTGESIWEFVERAGNYGVPLAFLLAVGLGAGRLWFTRIQSEDFLDVHGRSVGSILRITTVLLLVGHGMLAITGGNAIVANHLASIGVSSTMAQALGGFEIGVACVLMVQVSPTLLVAVSGWKLGTELLFVVAGAPFWEVIERGGSYTAPLLLAVLIAMRESSDQANPSTSWEG